MGSVIGSDPREWLTTSTSIRARLTAAYAIALVLGLVLFSAFSLIAIDTTLKGTLDARLSAVARAFAGMLTIHGARLTLSHATKQRLLEVLGVQQNGAIVLSDGTIVMQSAVVPASVQRAGAMSRSNNLSFSTVGVNSPLRTVIKPIFSGDTRIASVILWRPIDFVTDYEKGAEIAFVVVAIIVVATATWVAGLLAKRALRPLRSMAALASEIEAHDLSRRLGATARVSELSEFCATFDRTLDRLQAAFNRERQFTADASHDLRAPLSIIRAEVELALLEPLPSASEATLLSIQAEVDELDRLIDELLNIARAETQPLSSTRLDLSEVSRSAVKRMAKFAAARSVRIDANLAARPYVVGHRDLLERVIASLLHNAVKCVPTNGRVEILVNNQGAFAEFAVRDNGPGFSERALKHAFDRFWRDDAARGRGGSGLGLSIARATVQRFGGQISLENLAAGGAQVIVRLPSVV
jgi:two-component system, OmpR family, sensor kinase